MRIFSVGGLRDAVAEIVAGDYTATVTSDPLIGPAIVQSFADFESTTGVPATVVLPEVTITRANARAQLASAL